MKKRVRKILNLSVYMSFCVAAVGLIVYGLGDYIFIDKECEMPANTKVEQTVAQKVVTVREGKRDGPTAKQITSSDPKDGFSCKLQSNGVPYGYEIVTNGVLWTYKTSEGVIFSHPEETKEEAVKTAQFSCAYDAKRKYMRELKEIPWKTVE